MEIMKKRMISIALFLALCFGLIPAASAYDGAALDDDSQMIWVVDAESGGVHTESAPLMDAILMNGEQDLSLPQLSTPVDLEWGLCYEHTWKDGGEIIESTQVPGYGSWKLGEISQNQFKIDYYRVNQSGDNVRIAGTTWHLNEDVIKEGYLQDDFQFLEEDRDTGDYYFTVVALGDGTTYRDSEKAVSTIWHFEAPDAKLFPPEKPVWKDELTGEGMRQIEFEVQDKTGVLGYNIQWLYAPDLKTEPEMVSGTWWNDPDCTTDSLYDYAMHNGAGYYYAMIKAISSDITKYKTSDYSEMSDPLYISAESNSLNDIVNGVDETSTDVDLQKAVEDVRALDTAALTEAMVADKDNSKTAGQIARLEELAGIQTLVNVTSDMRNTLPEEEVSIIGAGLNANVGESVKLIIEKASSDFVVPTMYHNAVQFSMHLEDAVGNDLTPNGEQLEVPVKISLPVPAEINPDYLVIIHKHSDGTPEEVFMPYVHQKEDGKWYADFVVRSFSDFALAEQERTEIQDVRFHGSHVLCSINGDVNKGGILCAVYGNNDQMMAVKMQELDGTGSYQFDFDAEGFAYAKVFVVNEDNRPLCEALKRR